MAQCKTVILYGPMASREHAKILLENQPQIKRITASPDFSRMNLLLNDKLSEGELLALLSQSGVSGFQLRTP